MQEEVAPNEAYEHSEMLLYRAMVLEEGGHLDDALTHLDLCQVPPPVHKESDGCQQPGAGPTAILQASAEDLAKPERARRRARRGGCSALGCMDDGAILAAAASRYHSDSGLPACRTRSRTSWGYWSAAPASC